MIDYLLCSLGSKTQIPVLYSFLKCSLMSYRRQQTISYTQRRMKFSLYIHFSTNLNSLEKVYSNPNTVKEIALLWVKYL